MHQLQRSWVWSQHPLAQWNLRGGRWSSVEYRTKKKSPQKIFKKINSLLNVLFKGWSTFWWHSPPVIFVAYMVWLCFSHLHAERGNFSFPCQDTTCLRACQYGGGGGVTQRCWYAASKVWFPHVVGEQRVYITVRKRFSAIPYRIVCTFSHQFLQLVLGEGHPAETEWYSGRRYSDRQSVLLHFLFKKYRFRKLWKLCLFVYWHDCFLCYRFLVYDPYDSYFPFAIENFKLPSACACHTGAFVEEH